ncbi:HAMP domain-containing histidine kinase [Halovulum dunhuangense]|uniref:histidine kinase n=1 Tax=Halovulum dunhuangense TaxID=1505036 RepID=A0A849L5D0_9RHOB|nr:HAMP domain-containing sensor histidine kinase [Halovulum dunhuangense]NNU81384.1 HAMP domain-containing histidine kinase [Halovulum dunhuangense]
MTPRAQLVRHGGLVVLIAGCLGLLVVAATNIVRVERQMQIAATENMTWIFGQTQIEALNLAATLARDADENEVRRRFDLLVSRMNLLRDGPQWQFLQEAGLAEGLMGWRDGLLALDPAEGGDRAALQAHVTALSTALRTKASRVMAREWQVQAERLDDLRQLHLLALAAIVGALVAGSGLAFALVDRERRLARAELDRLRAARLERDLMLERSTSEGYRRFADLIAHQVRTPLAVIDSAMRRLTRPGTPPPADIVIDKARATREAVARLVRLTDTALLMARVDRDAIMPELGRHDLGRIAESAIDDLLVTSSADGVGRFRFRPGNRPATATCDPVLTAEILSNLLTNALLYAPDSKEIEVRPMLAGNDALCDICDRGPGMTPDQMARAFDNFSRGEDHRTLPGSGLGLPLARHLARLQGGDVTLMPRDGGGLVARLTLPCGEAA